MEAIALWPVVAEASGRQKLLVAGHTSVSDRKQRGWLKSELGYNLQRSAPDDPPLPAIFPIPQL